VRERETITLRKDEWGKKRIGQTKTRKKQETKIHGFKLRANKALGAQQSEQRSRQAYETPESKRSTGKNFKVNQTNTPVSQGRSDKGEKQKKSTGALEGEKEPQPVLPAYLEQCRTEFSEKKQTRARRRSSKRYGAANAD